MCIRDREAEHLAAVCRSAPPAAARADGWAPREFALFGDASYERVAQLLQLVEEEPVSYTHLRAHETSAHL
eukprot:4839212-Alexandrium_andersonii.AAC.1